MRRSSPGERLAVSPGAPWAVPAFSWNSLIHQHSSEISCRKDIFIDCDKKKRGGGREEPLAPPVFTTGRCTDGRESKHAFLGWFVPLSFAPRALCHPFNFSDQTARARTLWG